MPRTYTNIEELTEEVLRRKAAGETNRKRAECYGMTKRKVEQLITHQNRKQAWFE